MRIAICDDESIFRENLRKVIESYGKLPEETTIEEFSGGEALIDGHRKSRFDIIFLDIEMDGISGMEAGQKIREEDRKVLIVVVSMHGQYMRPSFKLEVFDYIVKPYESDEVYEVLKRALKKHRDRVYKINIIWREKLNSINIGDVVYIEVEGRHLKFVTQTEVYSCTEKLKNYEKKLSRYGFFRCHNSTLVNMEYIKRIEEKAIITEFGHKIDISRRKKVECLQAFCEYGAKYRI